MLDDDKAHFERGSEQYSAGLKRVRHTKDNRNGNTIHTAVLAGSQFICQIAYEREGGDTTEKCTVRIYHDAFNPMAPPGDLGDMSTVSAAKDRGYWEKEIIAQVMASGMKIEASTTKRMACIPFTFNQKLSERDKRTDVPVTGAKTLFIKKMTMSDRDAFSVCYRNGNGNCTLGLTTEHGAPEWELVLDQPADMVWYEAQMDEDRVRREDDDSIGSDDSIGTHDSAIVKEQLERRLKRCFKMLNVEDQSYKDPTEEFLDQLIAVGIVPLTMQQRTADWFMLRQFSLTSSTIDRIVTELEGSDWATNMLAGIMGNQGAEDEEEDDTSDEDEGEDDTNYDLVRPPLRVLLSSLNAFEAFRRRFDDDEVIPIDYVRATLTQLGQPLSKARDPDLSDKNQLRDWTRCAPAFRAHYFKSKDSLKNIAESLDIDTTRNDREMNKTQLRKAINEYMLAFPNEEIEVVEEAEDEQGPSKRQKVFQRIFESSFLRPLQGKAKKWTRRGHELEELIICECMKEQDNPAILGRGMPRVLQVCAAGLVHKANKSYVKDSIDFLGIGTCAGNESLLGVEVKGRVTHKTSAEERNHFIAVKTRLQARGRTDRERQRKYFLIDADSDDFTFFVRKKSELVQLMHHACCYELNHLLLLVGDERGDIIFGVYVNVPANLRERYQAKMDEIYDEFLSFAYEDEIADERMEELKSVLPFVKVNGDSLDEHSFSMTLALYKDICKMSFPLPKIVRIIPLVFAVWNSIKGGSDSITKMMWHCKCSTPNTDNQSHAVARQLMLCSVQLHKCLQLATAKPDLNFYSSLRGYRNAATQRFSYQTTLTSLVSQATRLYLPRVGQSVTTTRSNRNGMATPPRVTRRTADITRVMMGQIETGKTPKRNLVKKLKQLQDQRKAGVRLSPEDELFVQRTESCTGHLVRRPDRQRCTFCTARTPWYCLRCKRSLCAEVSSQARLVEGFNERIEYTVALRLGKTETISCANSCFHETHKDAMVSSLQEFVERYR